MSWTFEAAGPAFDRHAAEWDALQREHGNHILLDSRFVSALVRCFATPSTLIGVSTHAGSRGILLLERGRFGFASTFQPSQSPLGLVALESADRAIPAIREIIARLPGYGLGLAVLQQDPDYTLFPLDHLDRGAESLDYIDTSRVRIAGAFEDYWRGLGSNLTHNLRRQRKRLAEEGKSLGLTIVKDPAQAAECVATYGRLEAASWKAAGGTEVTADNVQGRFYRDILETFLAAGEAVVFQLTLDGQVIASDLCLERNGMLVILKTAYDAGLKGLSPGLLLHQEIIERSFNEGRIRVIEFYGRVREWHTKWTKDIRRMYHVNVYRAPWIAGARAAARRGIGLLKRSGASPAEDATLARNQGA